MKGTEKPKEKKTHMKKGRWKATLRDVNNLGRVGNGIENETGKRSEERDR